jgi:hypothetical protein
MANKNKIQSGSRFKNLTLVIIVLGIGVFGAVSVVFSHAATPTNTHAPTGSIAINACSMTASGSETDGDRPNDGARVIVTVQGVGGVDVNAGSSSWSYTIPSNFKDGQNHNVYATGRNVDSAAQNSGTNPALSGSPAVYNSSNCASGGTAAPSGATAPPPSGSTTPTNTHAPAGSISINACNMTASGNESDGDRPNDGARVIVTVQGVGGVNVNSGNTSWSYAIPSNFKDGQNHNVYATGRNVDSAAQNSGTNPSLTGSPAVYNSSNCASSATAPSSSTPPPSGSTTPTNTHAPTGSITIDACAMTASGSETDGDRPNDGARVIVTIQGVGGVNVDSPSGTWTYTIPDTFNDGQNHNVNATGRNVNSAAQNNGTNPVLTGSPAVYNSSNCASAAGDTGSDSSNDFGSTQIDSSNPLEVDSAGASDGTNIFDGGYGLSIEDQGSYDGTFVDDGGLFTIDGISNDGNSTDNSTALNDPSFNSTDESDINGDGVVTDADLTAAKTPAVKARVAKALHAQQVKVVKTGATIGTGVLLAIIAVLAALLLRRRNLDNHMVAAPALNTYPAPLIQPQLPINVPMSYPTTQPMVTAPVQPTTAMPQAPLPNGLDTIINNTFYPGTARSFTPPIAPPKNEPLDMYEAAQLHPESYGNTRRVSGPDIQNKPPLPPITPPTA